MDDSERDQILARLDARTKRVDEHLDRFEDKFDEHEEKLDNHDERISDNEDAVRDGRRLASALGAAIIAGISGIGAKLAGFLAFLK